MVWRRKNNESTSALRMGPPVRSASQRTWDKRQFRDRDELCREGGRKPVVLRVIKRAEAHYKAKDTEYGKVYRWCPERVVIQCVCGERSVLTGSVTTCDGCGMDHAAVFWGELFAQPSSRDEVD